VQAEGITLEAMWADITRVDGEVCSAGHYEGVEPQAGELALDRMVSGIADGARFSPADLVITSQTRRGVVRGALGDINFFPCNPARKSVAIVGMGRPGTFGMQALRLATRSLVVSAAALPSVETVNMLLIGSGKGNLDVDAAVSCMVEGVADAMEGGLRKSRVRRIRIVEWELRKAQQVQEALAARKHSMPRGIRAGRELCKGPGGAIGEDIALSAIVLATAWREMGRAATGAEKKAARQVLHGVPATAELRASCEKVLRTLGDIRDRGDVLVQAARLDLARRSSQGKTTGLPPTRTSFVRAEGGLRVAAISETAVVAERVMPVAWPLVDEIVAGLADPKEPGQARELSRLMRSLFVPGDFHERLNMGDRLIVEVDRDTARIPWEMMESFHGAAAAQGPIGLALPLARQLRTVYSPTPPPPHESPGQLRALVIGDPGDAAAGLSLPGARVEAFEVARLLRKRGVLVDLRVGARPVGRAAKARDVDDAEPATLLDTLRLLDNNAYDILHFAGHGDFVAGEPGRAGWIFGTQLFTGRELANIGRVPALVVANACLSSRTSSSELLPGLVDEFFHRGVRDYVGTAWPVDDAGAVKFARSFYESVLPEPADARIATIGAALLDARKALHRRPDVSGLWAAYQHYGDPAFELANRQSQGGS
jgi:hypothetical protein